MKNGFCFEQLGYLLKQSHTKKKKNLTFHMFIEIFNVELGLIETMSRKRRTVFNLLNSIVEQRKRILEESGALEFRSQLNQDRNFEATFGRNTGL